MKTPKRRRGLLDAALVLALLYGVYAATPFGTLAETGARWLAGQRYLPPILETFRGKDTRVDIGTFQLPGKKTAEPVIEQTEEIPEAVEPGLAALLRAMQKAHGTCDPDGCGLATPAALEEILPDETPGKRVDLNTAARAIQLVAPRFGHDPELCLEALYLGPEDLERAVTQARLSGLEGASDVEVHARFLLPAVRRGALQDALAALVHYRMATLAWPLEPNLPIASPFGPRLHPVLQVQRFHNGIDISAAQGTPLHAVHHGRVHRSSADSVSGNYLKIDHGLGIQSTMCHLDQVKVSEGQPVSKKQLVGSVGNTGRSTGPHLHFTLRINGKAVNPEPYRPTQNRAIDHPKPDTSSDIDQVARSPFHSSGGYLNMDR